MQGWSWPIDCDQLLYNQCIKEGTMSALEQMVLEKFRQLEAKQQQQVLDFLEQLQQKQVAEFDYEAWQARVDAIHDEILAQHGHDYSIDVQALLDEVREDAS
jgi:hypothetical protein